jgi:hypothetical protein
LVCFQEKHMNLTKFPFRQAALVALGAVLLAGAAAAQPKEPGPGIAPERAMGPGGRMMPMIPNIRTNFAFIPANVPASANKVGIFVARHQENTTTLYYCAMPADGSGNSVCKQVKGFPAD